MVSALSALTLAADAAHGRGLDVTARGYHYVWAQTTIDESTQKGIEVVCPGSEPVVGGGAFTDIAERRRIQINTSKPFDDDGDGRADDGWQVYADNVASGDPNPGTFGATAVCDARSGENAYRYRSSAATTAPEGAQTPVAVRCPKGEPVTGGGFRSSGFLADGMRLNTTRPLDTGDKGRLPEDGWRSWIDNETAGTPGQAITGYAICDRRRSAGSYAYRRAVASAIEESESSATAKCRQQERLVGGGVVSSGVFTDNMYATGTQSTVPGGASVPQWWYATVHNLAGGLEGQSIQAYAICRV